jgi:hypothetical protein
VIDDERLLSTIEQLLSELTGKAKNYRQSIKKGNLVLKQSVAVIVIRWIINIDGPIVKEFDVYCERIRRTLNKSMITIESQGNLLDETLGNWHIYENSYESLEQWLNENEQVLRQTSQDKQVRR